MAKLEKPGFDHGFTVGQRVALITFKPEGECEVQICTVAGIDGRRLAIEVDGKPDWANPYYPDTGLSIRNRYFAQRIAPLNGSTQ